MGTFVNKQLVDDLIANDGRYHDDPLVVRIVEYENMAGETCWGVVYVNEPITTWLRYDVPTQYVRNPRVIFVPSLPEERAT